MVRLSVTGARTAAEATKAARAAASSPLVKTAVYGADLNWGRVIAVLGRAGIAVDPMKISMRFAGETLLRRGMRPDPAAQRGPPRRSGRRRTPSTSTSGWGRGATTSTSRT